MSEVEKNIRLRLKRHTDDSYKVHPTQISLLEQGLRRLCNGPPAVFRVEMRLGRVHLVGDVWG